MSALMSSQGQCSPAPIITTARTVKNPTHQNCSSTHPHPPTPTPLQVKDVLMALYFAADHVVWAHQIGLLQDKKAGERAQKVSLWSWALGSVATMVLEANTILRVR